jgi:tripartite ATP-independent transporter DctM subunit
MELALLFGVFLVLLVLGVPVAVAMLCSSVVNLFYIGLPVIIAAQRMVDSINSFPLLAVPFFILAGVIMNQAGLTARLVELSRAYVGHRPGGTAQVNVLASIFFSGISGSASADTAAIGSMLIPAMKKEGYSPGFAAGITAASSTIGPIIPPSIGMVIYATITEMSIGRLFLAGIVPGLLIGLSLMILVHFMSKARGYPRSEKVAWRDRGRITFVALPAILAPVILLGGIFSGFYTPTEAGVVACLYGLGVGIFVYRDLKLRDLARVLAHAVEMTALPMVILASASVFAFLLSLHGFGGLVVDALRWFDPSPVMLLLLIVLMLLAIGLIVEGLAAMIIFVPVFMPLIPAFGLDELQVALIVLITLLIGTVTPPVGIQLYIAASVGDVRIRDVEVWPFVGAMLVVVVLLVFFPGLVTFVPDMVMGAQ